MRINEIFEIISETSFYVGDLCYVLPDELYHGLWSKYDYEDGVYTDPKTGLRFAMVSTTFGEGEYHDQDGFSYPVDSGIIGICPIELCTKNDPKTFGRVINFSGEVSIEYENGTIYTYDCDDENLFTVIETGTTKTKMKKK